MRLKLSCTTPGGSLGKDESAALWFQSHSPSSARTLQTALRAWCSRFTGCPTHSRSLCLVPRHPLRFVPGHFVKDVMRLHTFFANVWALRALLHTPVRLRTLRNLWSGSGRVVCSRSLRILRGDGTVTANCPRWVGQPLRLVFVGPQVNCSDSVVIPVHDTRFTGTVLCRQVRRRILTRINRR